MTQTIAKLPDGASIPAGTMIYKNYSDTSAYFTMMGQKIICFSLWHGRKTNWKKAHEDAMVASQVQFVDLAKGGATRNKVVVTPGTLQTLKRRRPAPPTQQLEVP